MRTAFLPFAAAVLLALTGCQQNAGSGSPGDSANKLPPPQQRSGSPSNAEQGEPPGSHRDGTGPAPGSPGGGSNPGAERSANSAAPQQNPTQ